MYQVPQHGMHGPSATPIGSLFGQTLELMRRHSGTFMALAALQAIPALLLGMYSYAIGLSQRASVQIQALMTEFQSRTQTGNPDDLIGFPWGMNIDAITDLLGISLISLLISSFIMRAFVQGATVAAVGDAYRTNEPSFKAAVRVAFAHVLPLLGWALLSAFAIFGITLLLLIPCLGLVIVLPLLAFFGIRLLFVPQAIVAEKMDVFQAMSHSWSLTRGSYWRMFGAWLLFVFLTALIVGLIVALINLMFAAILGPTSGAYVIFNQAISTLAQLLTIPIGHIGITLVYYDQQRRVTAPPPPPQPTIYPPYQ